MLEPGADPESSRTDSNLGATGCGTYHALAVRSYAKPVLVPGGMQWAKPSAYSSIVHACGAWALCPAAKTCTTHCPPNCKSRNCDVNYWLPLRNQGKKLPEQDADAQAILTTMLEDGLRLACKAKFQCPAIPVPYCSLLSCCAICSRRMDRASARRSSPGNRRLHLCASDWEG